MSETKILIVGGDSQIGSAFFSYLKRAGESVIATTRRRNALNDLHLYLDLDDDPDKWILPNSVNAAVIFSGITNIEVCAKDPCGSAKVNVEAVCALDDILIQRGAHIIFLSTNQVFNGSIAYPSPNDPISPVTEYGRQKAQVEQRFLSRHPDRIAILRITKVIGLQNTLLEKWVEVLKKGDVIHPFSDMFIAPVPMSFVLSVIRLVIDRRLTGIFHLSADKDISYAEVAYIAGRIIGVSESQIQPILARESNLGIELVTGRTALNTDRVKSELGVMPPETLWTIEQFFKNPKVLEGIT